MQEYSHHHVPDGIETEFMTWVSWLKAKRYEPSIKAPPLFIIAGKPGTGKSTIAKILCDRYGMHRTDLAAASIQSSYASGSASAIREAIVSAGNADEWFGLALLDDLDQSDARVDENQSTTINQSSTSAVIMDFADDPRVLRFKPDPDKPIQTITLERPPGLVVTVNNSAALFEPIVRAGRAVVVEYDPQGEDLCKIVHGMYPQCTLKQIQKLVDAFPDFTVADFSELGRESANAEMAQLVFDMGNNLRIGDWPRIAAYMAKVQRSASFKTLMDAGKAMAGVDRFKSYLKPLADGRKQSTRKEKSRAA